MRLALSSSSSEWSAKSCISKLFCACVMLLCGIEPIGKSLIFFLKIFKKIRGEEEKGESKFGQRIFNFVVTLRLLADIYRMHDPKVLLSNSSCTHPLNLPFRGYFSSLGNRFYRF